MSRRLKSASTCCPVDRLIPTAPHVITKVTFPDFCSYFLHSNTLEKKYTPNQKQKCFQKAFTESPHTPNSFWHQLFRRRGRLEDVTDVCRRESAERERERCRKAGKMIDFHRFFPPPLNPGHLVVVRMGQKQLAATCQVKLQTQTIKVWHVLSWKMITWPLWMDNPLKADQRKSKFWSRLQRVFTCRQSRCRRLQHLIQLRLRAADHWRPLQLLYMQMLQRQINSWKWQHTS